MTPAYRKGNPLLASNLSYLTVVLASLFGILLWHEHLAPRSWTGIVLLVLSGMLSAQHVPGKTSRRILTIYLKRLHCRREAVP